MQYFYLRNPLWVPRIFNFKNNTLECLDDRMVHSSITKKRYFDENICCQNHKETSYRMSGLSDVKNLMVQPPNQIDLAIVGSGYTGLNAAL